MTGRDLWLDVDIPDEEFRVEDFRRARARMAERNRRARAAAARARRIRRWEESIPARYRRWDFRNDAHWSNISSRIGPAGVADVEAYLDAPTCFAVLHGDNGLGKSILSVMLARELVGDGVVDTVEMVTGTDILHEFSTFNAFSDDGGVDPVRRYSGCGLLIVDDVAGDNERITASQEQKLATVLETRYRCERPTIMTTNAALRGSPTSGVGLAEYFPPRIWQRIIDDCTIITFTGETMRG